MMALTSKLALGLSSLSAAATCPSSEQLLGVSDCSDPCQASNPPCSNASTSATGAYTTISTPSGDYQVLANGQVVDPAGNVINTAASTVQGNLQSGVSYLTQLVSNSSSSIIPGISNVALAAIGGGLLLIVLLTSSGGRRR
jgi:hypothetical protein